MTHIDNKLLVYYYDESDRRLAIAEVDHLPSVGDVLTLWEGCTGRVIKITDGLLTGFGHPVTRIDMGGTRTTLD